jgi:hypothetical protein
MEIETTTATFCDDRAVEAHFSTSWYAVYTWARHEKRVKDQLDVRQIRCALRLQIIFFSMCLAVAARAFGILGRTHWQTIDAADPLKVFLQEVWDSFRAWGNSTRAEMFRLTLASRYV